MKSPFPGMDPYLEAHWRDVHARLISYCADALQGQLSDDLIARIEERVYVESEDTITRLISPDVRVVEHPSSRRTHGSAGGAAVAEPLLFEMKVEPTTERYIEILEANGNRVVTAIEFLSPSNKLPGEGFNSYRQKRREFHASDTNLVEIDLIRSGNWRDVFGPLLVPAKFNSTYRALVRRATSRDVGEYFPIHLREPLPNLPIPLRPGETDVVIKLQELIDKAYANGRYDRTDYTKPPVPPLQGDEIVFAGELLQSR